MKCFSELCDAPLRSRYSVAKYSCSLQVPSSAPYITPVKITGVTFMFDEVFLRIMWRSTSFPLFRRKILLLLTSPFIRTIATGAWLVYKKLILNWMSFFIYRHALRLSGTKRKSSFAVFCANFLICNKNSIHISLFSHNTQV